MIVSSECYTRFPNIKPLLENNMLTDNLIPWGTLNFHSGIAFSDKGLYVAIVFKTSTTHFDFFWITACFVLESQQNMWDIVMLAPAPHMGNSLSEPFPQRIANNKLKVVGIVLFTDGLCVKATCRGCFSFLAKYVRTTGTQCTSHVRK